MVRLTEQEDELFFSAPKPAKLLASQVNGAAHGTKLTSAKGKQQANHAAPIAIPADSVSNNNSNNSSPQAVPKTTIRISLKNTAPLASNANRAATAVQGKENIPAQHYHLAPKSNANNVVPMTLRAPVDKQAVIHISDDDEVADSESIDTLHDDGMTDWIVFE